MIKKLIAVALLITSLGIISVKAVGPLEGKIIVLDAGHGGDYTGAVNQNYQVAEKDVNLAVVYNLKEKLEADGAHVVLTRMCNETILNRRERVNIAKEKCESDYGGDCDVLVSVHHNGSSDPTYNGTMVIYNERQDIPLAKALLENLAPLTKNNEGLDHGGYGMTVHGHLVSALTEAYYITNDSEAEQYLNGTSTEVCSGYSVLSGERTNQESNAIYRGLIDYFNIPQKNPGRKGRK